MFAYASRITNCRIQRRVHYATKIFICSRVINGVFIRPRCDEQILLLSINSSRPLLPHRDLFIGGKIDRILFDPLLITEDVCGEKWASSLTIKSCVSRMPACVDDVCGEPPTASQSVPFYFYTHSSTQLRAKIIRVRLTDGAATATRKRPTLSREVKFGGKETFSVLSAAQNRNNSPQPLTWMINREVPKQVRSIGGINNATLYKLRPHTHTLFSFSLARSLNK